MTDMKHEANFTIRYDGPALAASEMDVHDLAPALLAMGGVVRAANNAIFGEKADVRVNVKGGFKSGCFEIDLILHQDLLKQITGLLSGQGATAFANAWTILGAIGLVGGGGLLGIYRWAKGRSITKAEQRDGKAVIYIESESLEIDLTTYRLYQHRETRLELAEMLAPLRQPGIESFASGQTGKSFDVNLGRDAAEWASAGLDQVSQLSSHINENIVLLIESPVFKDANKWRFHNGQHAFYAEMADEEFLQQVEDGRTRFGKGDRLVVDCEMIQQDRAGKLETTYRIVKVHEHREGGQYPLF